MARTHSLQETGQKYRKAFEAGVRDKAKGLERLSPYTDKDSWVDWWFYAGWDGKELSAAWGEFAADNQRISDLMKVGNAAIAASRIIRRA